MNWESVDTELERSWVGVGWLVRNKFSKAIVATIDDPTKLWTLTPVVIPPPIVVPPPVITPPPPVVVPPPVVTPPVSTRPPGTGLYVVGNKLFDAAGVEFIMRGINQTFWWGWKEHNTASIFEIAKTGANTLRMAFGANNGHTTAAEKDALIADCIKNKMIPVVGLWWSDLGEVTGKTDSATLKSAFDYWLKPEHVALLKKYEKHIVLNPANEWGPFNNALWVSEYNAGIARLRAAGVNCLIQVDAGGAFGQNITSIRDVGDLILKADPNKNVQFSFHAYSYHRTAEGVNSVGTWNDAGTKSPWLTANELKTILAKGLNVVCGEIAWEGSNQVGYDTDSMLADLNLLGVGWLAWSWNQNSDNQVDLMAVNGNWLYTTDADLSVGGKVFITGPQGLKTKAKKATSI